MKWSSKILRLYQSELQPCPASFEQTWPWDERVIWWSRLCSIKSDTKPATILTFNEEQENEFINIKAQNSDHVAELFCCLNRFGSGYGSSSLLTSHHTNPSYSRTKLTNCKESNRSLIGTNAAYRKSPIFGLRSRIWDVVKSPGERGKGRKERGGCGGNYLPPVYLHKLYMRGLGAALLHIPQSGEIAVFNWAVTRLDSAEYPSQLTDIIT